MDICTRSDIPLFDLAKNVKVRCVLYDQAQKFEIARERVLSAEI